jgi:hypothetical protein
MHSTERPLFKDDLKKIDRFLAQGTVLVIVSRATSPPVYLWLCYLGCGALQSITWHSIAIECSFLALALDGAYMLNAQPL